MIKRYKIETPEQLRALTQYSLIGERLCKNFATVWNANRNKNGGASAWDNDFAVKFVAEGRMRAAYIEKAGGKGDCASIADMKYNQTLHYCRENLTMIEDPANIKKE